MRSIIAPFFARFVDGVSRECHKIMTRLRPKLQNAPRRPRCLLACTCHGAAAEQAWLVSSPLTVMNL